MPRANWGISASDVDEFDRESQYKPYAGPIPPSGPVYLWLIKKLQFISGTKSKLPQLRVGLELVPREDRDEEQYEGYFVMAFLPVSEKTNFRYVPFLDAIGVTGREFERGTMYDEQGNIKKIGKWRNTGEEYICAQLKDGEDEKGNPRKEVGTFLEVPEEYFEDEDSDDDYYDEEEDPV